VDRARIAVMGWGDAPVAALLRIAGAAAGDMPAFAAGVSIVPASCDAERHPPQRPLLVLRAAGGPDPSTCTPQPSAATLEVRRYDGARAGFDDPRAGTPRAGTDGAQRRYDRLAHARALDDVAAFLARALPAPDRATPAATASEPESGTWAVDPHAPGADLPPAGHSAFDAVFSRAGPGGPVHEVPYPFARLLERLAHAAGAATLARPPLAATLIPLGRSLQREAAAPEYFRSPRIVVAVTGAPDTGVGPAGVALASRLFLGYQPRADAIEVVSYNEQAGRFEFQVVHDYAPGRVPRVRYARRALCTSCHHNAAPIFPDAPWDETTANPRVAERLAALGPRFHGVRTRDADAAVTAIDIATDEANLLPVYRRLWSEGCSSPSPGEAARCRAGALQAMVQYRLSGGAGFDRRDPLYAGAYRTLQQRNGARLWPQGLLVAAPNLPDRSPLLSPTPSVVPAALDPLRPRPPLARWEPARGRDLERLVRGLARALPSRHLALLERRLRDGGGDGPGRTLTARCAVVRSGFAGQVRQLRVECGTTTGEGDGFELRAQLRTGPGGTADGEVGWLALPGGSHARLAAEGRFDDTEAKRRLVLSLSQRDGGAALRAPDGNTIRALLLDWDRKVGDTASRFDASASLTAGADFVPAAAALARLAAQRDAALLDERFDGVHLAARLLAALGVEPPPRCCEQRPLPPPRLEPGTVPAPGALGDALAKQGPLGTLRHYCGACHGGDTRSPPGFLHPAGAGLDAAIAHCAERIHFRLSMWHLAPDERAVAPMPPVQGLSLTGTGPGPWRRGEALARLLEHTSALVREQGRAPQAVLAQPYHETRACLAPPEQAVSLRARKPGPP